MTLKKCIMTVNVAGNLSEDAELDLIARLCCAATCASQAEKTGKHSWKITDEHGNILGDVRIE